MRFSSTEIQHLLRAWLIISVAFAILETRNLFSTKFVIFAAISAISVGLGFLLHELAHKWLAQRYGCIAEFRASDTMLLAALAMSFFGFILAAPGAVHIHGNVNKARNGRISAIGPLVNLLLALAFFALAKAASAFFPHPLLLVLASYGMFINAWLGLFNLLPFWQLDGLKVLQWNRKMYGVMLASAVALMILTFVR
jgi:Zn-dependent protease